MNKKVINIFIIIIVAAIIFLAAWIRFVPAEKMPTFLKKTNLISKTLCIYPLRVQGSSMEPIIKEGSLINFSKCFNKEQLGVNNIIAFKDKNRSRISVIRETINLEGNILYKVSQEAHKQEIEEVYPDQIFAVYNK